jgi:threonine dehydratase
VKRTLAASFGAEVILHENRRTAEVACLKQAESDECVLIPPFDHNDVIAGQGTAALELLEEVPDLDAIIAPVGGGGLLSGTLITTRARSPKTAVLGAEPLLGNDASRTLQRVWALEAQGYPSQSVIDKDCIIRLKETPKTLADGAATLAVSLRTLQYLKQIDAPIFEITERQICYWTQWLSHTLKLHIEPTSAMGMAGMARWLLKQNEPKRVAVILSGGNIDPEKVVKLWTHNDIMEAVTLAGP